ncbi:hypothetical protein WH91_09775 [Devosia psychrophila]|uniref:Uncharacterized protein n=2 Tax=Devosia psychrophila TaxID=728005 RepID=A0ABR5DZ51_9HYPH|nr:hypothetical protein WH91_09775 [Devosia psychrophila]
MTCIHSNELYLCGNFRPYAVGRPKNWIDMGYKMIVPFKFQSRDKLRKATYTCTEVKEYYQPCYVTHGITVMSARFAKHLERHPDIQNFMWDRDPLAIGATD